MDEALVLAIVLSAVALMQAVHKDGVFELDRDATNAAAPVRTGTTSS